MEGQASSHELAHQVYLHRQISIIYEIMEGDPSTISRFVKAMFGIAMAGENDNFMATILQPHCSVDDQPLRSSDTQVRVEEEYVLLLVDCRHDRICNPKRVEGEKGPSVWTVVILDRFRVRLDAKRGSSGALR